MARTGLMPNEFGSGINETYLLCSGTIQLFNNLPTQDGGAQIVGSGAQLGGFYALAVTVVQLGERTARGPTGRTIPAGCVIRVLTSRATCPITICVVGPADTSIIGVCVYGSKS